MHLKNSNKKMENQISLEEYKTKEIDCLKRTYNYTTEEMEGVLMNPKELWEQ